MFAETCRQVMFLLVHGVGSGPTVTVSALFGLVAHTSIFFLFIVVNPVVQLCVVVHLILAVKFFYFGGKLYHSPRCHQNLHQSTIFHNYEFITQG